MMGTIPNGVPNHRDKAKKVPHYFLCHGYRRVAVDMENFNLAVDLINENESDGTGWDLLVASSVALARATYPGHIVAIYNGQGWGLVTVTSQNIKNIRQILTRGWVSFQKEKLLKLYKQEKFPIIDAKVIP